MARSHYYEESLCPAVGYQQANDYEFESLICQWVDLYLFSFLILNQIHHHQSINVSILSAGEQAFLMDYI
jgi:hypothetical protein